MKRIICLLLLCFAASVNMARAQEPPTKIYEKVNLSYDNLLIVEVFVNKIPTGDVIEIYQHDGGFLLPLGALTDAIHFAIEVRPEERTARGWFMDEKRLFSLNLDDGEVVVDGKKMPLDSHLVVPAEDDVYIDSSLFSKWFPADTQLNYSDMVLYLLPREKLPIETNLERQKLREKAYAAAPQNKNYDTVTVPYQLYSFPFVDAELGYNYATNQSPENQLSYSMLASGDLGYLTTQLALAGESDDSLTTLRLNAGRSDYKGELLGKLHATSFLVGDINAESMALTTTNSRGRGITLTNKDLTRPEQFDATSFTGNALPGWEVELYHNGVLLDFQLIDEDGRYDFQDVPIFFGNNVFRIVSYGPQGQIEEKVLTQLIDSSILQKGEVNYAVSVDEKSRSIFGVDEERLTIDHEPDTRVVTGIEYGLTNGITANAGYARTPLEDGKTHDYQMLGLRGSIPSIFEAGMLTELNTVYDSTDGGWAAQLLANARVGELNVRAEQSLYDNFVSEVERADAELRTSVSQLDLDGQLNWLFPSGISYRFGGKYEEFEQSRTVSTISNRLAVSVYGVGISNNLDYTTTKNEDARDSQTTGSVSVRGRYKRAAVRLSLDYDVEPEATVRSFNSTMQWQLEDDTNLRVGLQQDLTGEQLTSVDVSWNKTFKHFTWSLIGQADDNDNYTAGTRISFSMGKEPRKKQWFMEGRESATGGAVSAQAFLDKNYNNQMDEDEELLEDVGYITGNGKKQADGKEPVLVTHLEPHLPSDVEIDYSTLEDPFWTPRKQGYTVVPRPGVTTVVDFPVHNTTEIDGMTYLYKAGEQRPVARVDLELKDESGTTISTTRSEFDGFYIFEGVIPGTYTISATTESLLRLNASNRPSTTLTVEPNGDIVSGIDLIITSDGVSRITLPSTPEIMPATPQPIPATQSRTPEPVNKQDDVPYDEPPVAIPPNREVIEDGGRVF